MSRPSLALAPIVAFGLALGAACARAGRPASTPTPTPLAHTGTQTGGPARLKVSLERTACYGWCPVYRVSVFTDGKLVYEGELFVKLTGRHEATVTAEQLAALDRAFAQAGWFELADSYERYDVTDAPSVNTTYSDGAREKTVRHYHGDSTAPERLTRLEDEVDRILEIERFIGSEKEREELWRKRRSGP